MVYSVIYGHVIVTVIPREQVTLQVCLGRCCSGCDCKIGPGGFAVSVSDVDVDVN